MVNIIKKHPKSVYKLKYNINSHFGFVLVEGVI